MLKLSLLPDNRDKYYDYIVKWCSGVAGNCCESLDIGLILALMYFIPFSEEKHIKANT